MKRTLVLAMAMALGVTASSYAANPFGDVSAGHWAYGSIEKLAAAGVIDGYGDGTFGGDKLMTRYEMAQIVAKAMAKGANVDKLAAEFADELDTLGVRVANLEKKADNVKITGQARLMYRTRDVKVYGNSSKHSLMQWRSRLWVNGDINDDWTYTGMLQNTQTIHGLDPRDCRDLGHSGEDELVLNRAYVDGKIGGLTVHAGRWDEVTFTGNVLDSYIDGIKVSYGDKVKVFGLVGKGAGDYHDRLDYMDASEDRIYVIGAEAKVGVVDAFLGYFKADTKGQEFSAQGYDTFRKEIWNVGLRVPIGNSLSWSAEYMRGKDAYYSIQGENSGKDGWVTDLAWKGANAAEVGSYGLHVGYFDQSRSAYFTPTTDADIFHTGYKGYVVGASYAPAKNIVAVVNFYDTKDQVIDQKSKVVFSELYFTF